MSVLIALLPEKYNLDFPAIVVAARVYGTAKRLGVDRIRVERYNGVRVNEFTLPQVEQFFRVQGILVQRDRRAQEGQDYEIRRPIWAGRRTGGTNFGSE